MGDEEKTYKVTVVVSKREGFNGVYGAGKFWPAEAETEAELTEKEIAIVASKPSTVVLKGGKIVKPTGPLPSSAPGLSQDEEAALAEYRAAKAKNPKLAAQYGARVDGDGKPFTTEKGDVNEALAAAGSSVAGGGGPIDNADILHGKPPAEGVTSAGTSSPLGTNTNAGRESGKGSKK